MIEIKVVYMRFLLLLLLSFFFAKASSQQVQSDSVEYDGIKMSIAERDTLRDKLEKDSLPICISYVSEGPDIAFNTPYSKTPINIPPGTKIYVIREAEENRYICETANRMLFMYRPDIELSEKMDSILSIPSEIYQVFRIKMSEIGMAEDYLVILKKLKAYYIKVRYFAKKRIIYKKPEYIERLLDFENSLSTFTTIIPVD